MKTTIVLCFGLIAALSFLPSSVADAQPFNAGVADVVTDREVERPLIVDRMVIDETTTNPVRTLIDALLADNRKIDNRTVPIVVEFCNVDIDLTGQSLTIGSHRSLIASPGCERSPRRLGPRIFVTDNPPGEARQKLFVIRGDYVTFSGFRLEGPNPGIWGGDENTSFAIAVNPYEDDPAITDPDSVALPIRRIEVSNMEIFHWSGGAIYVTDNSGKAIRGRLFNTNEGAVRIVHNFLHHNRHDAGYGYGVDVAGGAYALIERNVFDENRHAIAGGSGNGKGDYSGYTLRENLILPGGGLHCLANWGFMNCWYTHQIDMHGDKDWWRLGQACCGTAGETMIIQRNTILYTGGSDWHVLPWLRNGNAIKIRGNPTDKVIVDGNVFRHADLSNAIAQNGDLVATCVVLIGWPCVTTSGDKITRPIIVRSNNVFGANPLNGLASCDFVGDGRNDQFMATGVTWWAKSPITEQWRYLNTMPQKMAELQLIDLDNDGICDVAERSSRPEIPPRRYSKSGTAPWVQWLGSTDPTSNNAPGGGVIQ